VSISYERRKGIYNAVDVAGGRTPFSFKLLLHEK